MQFGVSDKFHRDKKGQFSYLLEYELSRFSENKKCTPAVNILRQMRIVEEYINTF
jgi:hypothetical protein